MSEQPKVSVVTTSFNQGPYLRRCIESVLSQDYDNIEYIVVDPGSTDGSREIIEEYRDRIDHIILEPDEGHSDGLNKGFRAATGEIYSVSNSDDAYLPGAISEGVALLQAMPDADMIYGHGYVVDADGQVTSHFISHLWDNHRYVHAALAVMHQATFYRKEAYWGHGGFNPETHSLNDAEMLFEMERAGVRMERVRRFWGILTVHPTSDTATGAGKAGRGGMEERLRNREIQFEIVHGRQRRWRDWPRDRWGRWQKWLIDPWALQLRLRDAIFGPPDLRFPP